MCRWNVWLTGGGARWVAGPSTIEKTETTVSRPHRQKHIGLSLYYDAPVAMSKLLPGMTEPSERDSWWNCLDIYVKSLRSFPVLVALEYYWCRFSLVCSAWFEVLSWLDMIILGLFFPPSTLWRQIPRNIADFQGTSLRAPRLRTIMKMNGKLSLLLNFSFS